MDKTGTQVTAQTESALARGVAAGTANPPQGAVKHKTDPLPAAPPIPPNASKF